MAAPLRSWPLVGLAVLAGCPILAGCRGVDVRGNAAHDRSGARSIAEQADQPAGTVENRHEPAIAQASGVASASDAADHPDLAAAALKSPDEALAMTGSHASIPITLDAAIATALDRNPNLATLRASEPVAQEVCRVAQTYPWNPYVQIEVLPYARDQQGSLLAVTHYVLLMQTLELAHQGQYRDAGAAAALNQVRWNIVQAELTNAAQTERLFFAALYQRDLRDLAQRSASLNEEVLGVVERRFKAGLAKVVEQTAARVAARQSRKQAALAEANFQTALLALRRQLNMSTDEPVTLTGRLEDFSWTPIVDTEPGSSDSLETAVPQQVAAQLASERPDVMAAQAGTNTAQANAGLARANMVQNIQIGPFYERDESGTVFAGFRTQMNLPVWDTGRPLVRQREAEVRQQLTTLEQLRTRAEVEVQTAIQRYERARRLARRERSDFSRTIPEELQKLQQQFEAGQADILIVFASQNSLLQEYRTYLDLLNELAQAAADVTLAAGMPPARFISD